MKATTASCTGLSIMLVDACRAVGVPARVVGTPQWAGGRGNHTWVEIWDNGWRYIGASESKALDTGWFAKNAAGQKEGSLHNAIYAASFKPTGHHFPLVWNSSIKYVHALDVTSRYIAEGTKQLSLDEMKQLLNETDLSGLLDKLKKEDRNFSITKLAGIKELLWQKYVTEITKDTRRLKEHKEKAVSYNGKTMRYDYKRVGQKPEAGYSLYIAMHGGGGAPARVNDAQWQHMKSYYLSGVTNGIYLAPRGINNAWNLHWIKESFACYDRIIENMIAFGEVDPNRVYLMGYSAGGDAAYQIPARMPDRWAGVAMSAGHPNGVKPDNYASLAFLIQVGEKDAAYKRNEVAAEYGVKLDKLKTAHPTLYEHATRIHAGRGHGFMDHDPSGKPQKVYADAAAWLEKGQGAETSALDCNSIRWLDRYRRDPLPKKVIWDCKTQSDRSGEKEEGFWPTTEKSRLHYWLGLDRYDKDEELDATRIVVELDKSENAIKVTEIGNYVRLYLSPEMLDLAKDITVRVDGKSLSIRPKASLRVLVQSLLDRGDPEYAFPVCLTVSRNPEGTWMLE